MLVKPQFEVGRRRLGRGGVVTAPADRTAAVLGALAAAARQQGLHLHGVVTSPVSGGAGNVEYLLWARSVPSDTMNADRARAAVREVTEATPGGPS